MQLWHALIVKWHLAAYKNIQDDTKTPNVNLGTSVGLCLQKFWCCKVKRATEGLEQTTGSKGVAQTKVDNLDVASLADEDVFDLEITVYDTVPVTVVESTGYLATKLAGLLLLKTAVRDDVVQHLTTVDVFEQHVPVVVRADDIAHPTDVRVVDQGNNGSLAGSADLLGVVGSFTILGSAVLVGRLSRNYFDCDLELVRTGHQGKE